MVGNLQRKKELIMNQLSFRVPAKCYSFEPSFLDGFADHVSQIDALVQLENSLPAEFRTLSKVPYGWDLQNLDFVLHQDGTATVVCKVYDGEKHVADGLIVVLDSGFEEVIAFPICLFLPFDDEDPRFPRS